MAYDKIISATHIVVEPGVRWKTIGKTSEIDSHNIMPRAAVRPFESLTERISNVGVVCQSPRPNQIASTDIPRGRSRNVAWIKHGKIFVNPERVVVEIQRQGVVPIIIPM